MRGSICLLICLLFITGCALNMENQAKVEPFEASEFFANNLSARPLPSNTVPHGRSGSPEGFYTGRMDDGTLLETFPVTVTETVIAQGRVQYDVYCSPCHGQSGEGDGVIVQHGFSPPPSFHIERLRQAPVGHYFEVMTQGVGKMFSYGDRVPAEDRWAITAYIRALQLNRDTAMTEVPAEEDKE